MADTCKLCVRNRASANGLIVCLQGNWQNIDDKIFRKWKRLDRWMCRAVQQSAATTCNSVCRFSVIYWIGSVCLLNKIHWTFVIWFFCTSLCARLLTSHFSRCIWSQCHFPCTHSWNNSLCLIHLVRFKHYYSILAPVWFECRSIGYCISEKLQDILFIVVALSFHWWCPCPLNA